MNRLIWIAGIVLVLWLPRPSEGGYRNNKIDPNFGGKCPMPGNVLARPECCISPLPTNCSLSHLAGGSGAFAIKTATASAGASAAAVTEALAAVRALDQNGSDGTAVTTANAAVAGKISDAPLLETGKAMASGTGGDALGGSASGGATVSAARPASGLLGITGRGELAAVQKKDSEGLLDGGEAMGGARSKGAAGGTQGGSWSLGDDIGSEGEGGAAGAPGSLELGGRGGLRGANGELLSLEDPEDYFARLSLGDSLFKVVERRYRTKEASLSKAH